MRAIGPTAPKFGPKQTTSNHPRDVGIGGGPPRGGGRGPNRKDDTGLAGKEAATMGRGAHAGAGSSAKSEGTESKHAAVVDRETLTHKATDKAGKVVGDNPHGPDPGLTAGQHVGAYDPEGNRHGGHSGSTAGLGQHGRHHSTKGYEHSGHMHTSKHR